MNKLPDNCTVLYEDSLGINFTGYPIDMIDIDGLKQAIAINHARRFTKNVEIKAKLIIEEVIDKGVDDEITN